nr:MAG TPA: hypothetical protein [Caudoviricetes sp.]
MAIYSFYSMPIIPKILGMVLFAMAFLALFLYTTTK